MEENLTDMLKKGLEELIKDGIIEEVEEGMYRLNTGETAELYIREISDLYR